MDQHATDTHKCTVPLNQPGLEVRNERSASPDPVWPDASKAVWGIHTIDKAPPPMHQSMSPYSEQKKIFGLSVGAFWGVVVLLALLVGGGVGGGVGAGLASQKKSTCTNLSGSSAASGSNGTVTTTVAVSVSATTPESSAATTTTTSPASSVSPAPFSHCEDRPSAYNGSYLLPLDASGLPIPYMSSKSQTFQVVCNTNWPGGAAYNNPGVHDIMKIYQPDLMSCVAACAEYNAGWSNSVASGIELGGGYCLAVSLVIKEGEFCYLKNGTGRNDTGTSGEGVRIDSAVLM